MIALDAQALREAGWPNPNANLGRLAEMCRLLGIKLWILKGALDEVRGWYERRIAETISKVNGAIAKARQAGLEASGDARGTHRLLSEWDAQSERSTKELQAYVVGLTRRSTEEFFGMAVRRTRPFDDKGTGFRDAVLYLSLVDEMSRMGLSDAILVSNDRDFTGCESPVQGQRIRAMDVTAAINELEGVIEARRDAAYETVLAFGAKLKQLAREAILEAAPTIEGFLNENLEIGSDDVDGFEGWLKRPLSFRLKGVETLTLSPGFEDVPGGQEVQVSAILEIIGEFEVLPFSQLSEYRLRAGEDIRSRIRREAVAESQSSEAQASRTLIQSATFPVQMDLRLKRTGTGYADVVPTRVITVPPSMRALLAVEKSR